MYHFRVSCSAYALNYILQSASFITKMGLDNNECLRTLNICCPLCLAKHCLVDKFLLPLQEFTSISLCRSGYHSDQLMLTYNINILQYRGTSAIYALIRQVVKISRVQSICS